MISKYLTVGLLTFTMVFSITAVADPETGPCVISSEEASLNFGFSHQELLEYAEIANSSYVFSLGLNEKVEINGKNFKVIERTNERDQFGLTAVSIYNHSEKILYVSYRGSSSDDARTFLNDWVLNDFGILLTNGIELGYHLSSIVTDFIPDNPVKRWVDKFTRLPFVNAILPLTSAWVKGNIEAAEKFFAKTLETARSLNIGESKVVITGHSLGGFLAQLVGAKTGYETHTFNAPGVAASFLDNGVAAHDRIFNHSRKADVVGRFGFHLGKLYTYPHRKGSVNQHSIDGFLTDLKTNCMLPELS